MALPDPQAINGTCAKVLPLRTRIRWNAESSTQEMVKTFVNRVQVKSLVRHQGRERWAGGYYVAANTSQAECGDTAWFPSQPFESPAKKVVGATN